MADLKINPQEITEALRKNLEDWSPTLTAETVGYVTALGDGVTNDNSLAPVVQALAVSGTDVYVGGDFKNAGGQPVNAIARWDGAAWHSLGQGVLDSFGGSSTGEVHAIEIIHKKHSVGIADVHTDRIPKRTGADP